LKLNLPVAALRSFVAIAAEGSMVGAASRVFLTQSALSLQIKRLEDLLQVCLFDRQGRNLVLTEDGARLLGYAQELLQVNDRAVEAFNRNTFSGPVRVGVVQDFADTLLSDTLASFARQNPAAQVQVRVAGSQELRDLLASDRLDLALYLSNSQSPAVFRRVGMCWLGDDELVRREILPLALLEEPCLFRAAALHALEAAGRPYQIVMETQSLSALRAAVVGGIALTCRTRIALGEDAPATQAGDLPPLPDIALVLEARDPVREPVRHLRALIRTSLIDPLEPATAPSAAPAVDDNPSAQHNSLSLETG
jgi:DNA-binding transcriptional LysR family regulator